MSNNSFLIFVGIFIVFLLPVMGMDKYSDCASPCFVPNGPHILGVPGGG
jgi:hypothetical protein